MVTDREILMPSLEESSSTKDVLSYKEDINEVTDWSLVRPALRLQSCRAALWDSYLNGPHPMSLVLCLLVVIVAMRGWTSRRDRLSEKGNMELGESLQGRRNRERTDSLGNHSSIRRFLQRSRSEGTTPVYAAMNDHASDALDRLDDLEFLDTELDQPWLYKVRLSQKTVKRFVYKGPTVRTIRYKTMVPPPSWSEINRRLLQQNLSWKLHRSASLHLGGETATITLREALDTTRGRNLQKTHDALQSNSTRTSKDFTISVHEVGVHVKTPVQGGVLEIYVKGSPRDEWREHTFRSAAAAAQFQVDLLALQYLGKAIHNMYQALELIHRGSDAYTGGPEIVLHDQAFDRNNLPTVEHSGVAWDDLMRCLGSSFSSMRTRLEALWWVKCNGNASSMAAATNGGWRRKQTLSVAQGEADDEPTESPAVDDFKSAPQSSLLASEYVGKRLMLGVVDFFRLFVPLLSDKAVPNNSTSRGRMEQLLSWRKRVARASVLVEAYVRARTVVNRGWILGPRPTPVAYLKRRLAFDDDRENAHHDVSAKNEYYEASVSRDVACHVRGRESLKKLLWRLRVCNEPATASSYQAYSLVGIHSFQWVPLGSDYPLQPDRDPVLAIPSLRALLEKHPKLDFFIHAFYSEGRQCAAIVKVFVRSLPKGVDENFDRVVSVLMSCFVSKNKHSYRAFVVTCSWIAMSSVMPRCAIKS
jgi:hypothetical protein